MPTTPIIAPALKDLQLVERVLELPLLLAEGVDWGMVGECSYSYSRIPRGHKDQWDVEH